MSLILPPIWEGRFIHYAHFPTAMQCFIYRNWGIVPVSRLAAVLQTEEEVVRRLAIAMGLPENPPVNPKWLNAGYITIIKANWQLISYDQLCLLLGWDRNKLAYILKEDDFLDIKLGNGKPSPPPLVYQPLTKEQLAATESVREATLEAIAAIHAKTGGTETEPFDFLKLFQRAADAYAKEAILSLPERFDTRIVYSYCALYGDTFLGDPEESFPDELLRAYQILGINGIWCQAVLYTLVPFPLEPKLSEGWQQRLDGLRKLTERLDRFGIKLYLYINEPRAMPERFFDAYPEWKGAVRDGLASLCTSNPDVRKYLFDGAAQIMHHAPKLGGFITITASENRTHCYSHFPKAEQNCPRCAEREPFEVIAEVNRVLYEGAASVNPDCKLLAWTWGWEVDENFAIIDRMPRDIGVMAVSERLAKKNIGGIDIEVNDYSISVMGPGEYAKSVWQYARAGGHKAYAKCQFNNTWECAAVPFLPVFELVYRHIGELIESGVSGLMLGWTLGGYPSPTLAMLREMYDDTGQIPSLDELYARIFPPESVETVKRAVKYFSTAFDAYPFHIHNLYFGPQNTGPANLLYEKPTGFSATMVCFPYDDLENWRAVYPEDVFEEQFRILTENWAKGLAVLDGLDKDAIAESPVLAELVDCAEAAYCHFRSVYLQTRFIRLRDSTEAVPASAINGILEEELDLCVRLAAVSARNPAIGYESSNHYFYNRPMLLEKYVNCRYLQKRLRQIWSFATS